MNPISLFLYPSAGVSAETPGAPVAAFKGRHETPLDTSNFTRAKTSVRELFRAGQRKPPIIGAVWPAYCDQRRCVSGCRVILSRGGRIDWAHSMLSFGIHQVFLTRFPRPGTCSGERYCRSEIVWWAIGIHSCRAGVCFDSAQKLRRRGDGLIKAGLYRPKPAGRRPFQTGGVCRRLIRRGTYAAEIAYETA